MKKSVLLIVLLFLGVTVYAQNNNTRRQGDAPRRERTMRRSFSPEEMAKAEVDAINAAVGVISGAIAATGLGMVSQAGLTAIVSGTGNYVEQVYTKGFDNVNGADVIGSSLLGAGTSVLGSLAGEIVGKPIKEMGKEILGKAQDKLLTGMVRETLGQSHSAYFRQGAK